MVLLQGEQALKRLAMATEVSQGNSDSEPCIPLRRSGGQKRFARGEHFVVLLLPE